MSSPIIIPVIDLFAGPGGLNEGFSFDDHSGLRFKSVLSIEMDSHAHDTLELRAFYRYFLYVGQEVPEEYYQYVLGKLTKKELYDKYVDAATAARKEAYQATLGQTPDADIQKRISDALTGYGNWVLIGGPPCQAYSLAGRVKNMGVYRSQASSEEEAKELFDNDLRQTLYLQYLKIIAKNHPAIFIMENVRGILSAKVRGERIFPKILRDLKNPILAIDPTSKDNSHRNKYRILSFVTGNETNQDTDYLIRSEEYGLPQARHRVILLGIREDIYLKGLTITPLEKSKSMSVQEAIGDLPELRSVFSDMRDSLCIWKAYLSYSALQKWVKSLNPTIQNIIENAVNIRKCKELHPTASTQAYDVHKTPNLGVKWYADPHLTSYLNHESRSHMHSDVRRYLFVSAYGAAMKISPLLCDFPFLLLPKHNNVLRGNDTGEQKFADRFKVQLANEPSSTVTSHISKDGHYFIHYDPVQCRSLTVREAARLQTFPDNYFFEGNRTEQYHQVGNAVPPYLAKQLADVVRGIFHQILNIQVKS